MIPDYEQLKSYWFIACRSKQLRKKPRACTILGMPLVLFRGEGRKPTALLDRCPHRNLPLSCGSIKGHHVECCYHGWQFDSEGVCQKVPGLTREHKAIHRNVAKFLTAEKYGFIWVNLSHKVNAIYPPPFLNKSGYSTFTWETEFEGALIDVLENFLDGTHTHFVHKGLIRGDSKRQSVQAQVSRSEQKVVVCYTGEGKQSGIISQLFERDRKESWARFMLPAIAELEYRSSVATTLAITAYLSPISASKHKIYAVISFKKSWFSGFLGRWLITPFFALAVKQDQKILKLQKDNMSKFQDKPHFISTQNDLLRPHILELLAMKHDTSINKSVAMEL